MRLAEAEQLELRGLHDADYPAALLFPIRAFDAEYQVAAREPLEAFGPLPGPSSADPS